MNSWISTTMAWRSPPRAPSSETMALNSKEKEILAQMRTLTVKTQPLVVQAVDKALKGDTEEGT